MKTNDLIDTLAADLKPVPRAALLRRLLLAASIGGAIALALALAYGLREDLLNAVQGGAFWMKATFTMTIAVLAFLATAHVSRPGAHVPMPLILIAVPFVVMLYFGWMELAALPAPERKIVWLGQTWRSCPWSIIALSIPPLVLLLRAVRRLAPTAPGIAGLVVGLLSGAIAATAYGLHCPERAASFVATWYVLGILGSGVLGAFVGKRVLRW